MKSPRSLIAAMVVIVAGAAVGLGPDDGIGRVGAGQHRTALNEMELKPFNGALWGELSGWTNGSAVTAAATEGKVVLVFTWKSWHAVTHKSLSVAQKLADTYGKDGLIVVGVHDKSGFDKAAEVAAASNAKFVIAHDAGGKFADGIKADHAPAYYLIDRAGNMRFADADGSSLDKAASALVKETAEQAAALPGSRAAAAAKDVEEARKSRPVAENYKPGQILDVPFTMPDASLYTDVKWPEKNTDQLGAKDVQGQALPAGFDAATWITEKPSMNGRVVVLDFWATWCGPCKRAMPGLDSLQKANRQDLVIVGMSGQTWGHPIEDIARVKSFITTQHKSAYSHANDLSLTLCKALNIQGIPHVVVMSTDGTVRWQGNPLEAAFRQAVEQTLRVDPGVAARRKAEEAFQKSAKG